MPELPEVELVARALDRLVRGRRVLSARLLRPRLAPDSAPGAFARRLRGAALQNVGRRGKHILAEFDNGQVLVTHLRMTGRFMLLPEGRALPAHTHALFQLDDGRRLAFTDQRHFGFMRLVRAAELAGTKELRRLAPEPLSQEFSADYLGGVLAGSRRTLKETLLDQTKVAGLGNIYAAEALFIARANPTRPAAEFARRRVPALRESIVRVLSEAIAHGSTMNVDPEDIDGSYYGGPYEGRWRVYDREGEACPACSRPVRRITQGGRSTYFCPRCQRV